MDEQLNLASKSAKPESLVNGPVSKLEPTPINAAKESKPADSKSAEAKPPIETPLKVVEPKPPLAEYTLTKEESLAMRKLHAPVVGAKVLVFNLNAQLEEANKQVLATEARLDGAMNLLALSHGMENAKLDSEFKVLTKV